ncbi:MAG: glycosyltransferase [Methylovirgula sp.]
MDFTAFLAYLGAAWLVIAIAFLLMTCGGAFLQPILQARRATETEQPPVSALLPIKLRYSGFLQAQASVFDQVYPQYEVLFSAAEANSPALETAEQLKADHPHIATRILQSHTDFAVSPKLNTLATPLFSAAYDTVFAKDSNIVLEPDTMAVFARNLTPGVGLVVGVPVAEQASGLAGHVEAMLINCHARLLLTASALGFGFGVGKVMLFRRSDFAKAGGVDAMAYTLAEDTAIAKGLAAIGLKTVFAHRTVRQLIGLRRFRDVFERQVRWSVIRRAHEPFTFPLEPIANALPAAAAAALAAPLLAISPVFAFAATLLGWLGCEIGLAWLKGWEISPYAPLAFLAREILVLTAWLKAFTTYDVVWANGQFDVFAGAHALSRATVPSSGHDRGKADRLRV